MWSIAITTKGRTDYLSRTLHSLDVSGHSSSSVRVFDDTQGLGVHNNSRLAIRTTFAACQCPGMFLFQDDVEVQADWQQVMAQHIGHTFGKPQGLLAGLSISPYPVSTAPVLSVRYVSGQLLYIPRHVYEAAAGWFAAWEYDATHWDTYLCNLLVNRGYEIHLVNPQVGQHIGVQTSLPHRQPYRTCKPRTTSVQ